MSCQCKKIKFVSTNGKPIAVDTETGKWVEVEELVKK